MASILIVEDAWLSRRVICKILQAAGYETLEAPNGLEALNILQTHNPDCILLDLLMPGMEGREVLKALRLQGCTIPVIVITADIQASTREECLELGALTVLNKMPNAEELTQWVRKALASREERES